MNETIPMGSPDVNETDVQGVLEVLRSGRLALGQKTKEFEESMAGYVGVRHAVAVSSGTAALHLAVKALGIGRGEQVLVPAFTFAASANVLLYEGAVPVFVDIEPTTYNLDPEDVERKITSKTKAIMVVDVFGHPAAWDEILRIAERYGLQVIDDSCEALGAQYRGRKIGQLGDVAAFAFYPNKQITTGEGGMIVTDSEEIAMLCRSLLNQGRSRMGSWLEHERLGYNYRMDEMSAALGASQLRRIESFLTKRRGVAQMYTERLADLRGIQSPVVAPHVLMSWFVYVATLDEGLDRDEIMQFMESKGIPVRAYFPPLHRQHYIRDAIGEDLAALPRTESIASRTLALPFHNNLSVDQVERVVAALAQAIGPES